MKKYFTLKRILLTLLIIFIAIQFIRPSKNLGQAFGRDDITHSLNVPEDIKTILVASCYDCHSNFTNHMWYENIQPLGWWIADHINEGKRELNFSEFNTYKMKRKAHKLEEVAEQVKEDEMPLSSYTIMHSDAKLSPEQKDKLIKWAMAGHDSLKAKITEETSH